MTVENLGPSVVCLIFVSPHSGELFTLEAFFVLLVSATFHWLDHLPRDSICHKIYSENKKLFFFFFFKQSCWHFQRYYSSLFFLLTSPLNVFLSPSFPQWFLGFGACFYLSHAPLRGGKEGGKEHSIAPRDSCSGKPNPFSWGICSYRVSFLNSHVTSTPEPALAPTALLLCQQPSPQHTSVCCAAGGPLLSRASALQVMPQSAAHLSPAFMLWNSVVIPWPSWLHPELDC